MIRQSLLTVSLIACAYMPMHASTYVQKIIHALRGVECYHATARFSVTMPQLADDVVYGLELTQTAAPADTLLPCTYLIDWTMTSRENPVTGFSAYFSGNHYRYSGQRIQEYHMSHDPIPFLTIAGSGITQKGVQRTAQFANLLPSVLAETLQEMSTSSMYTLTYHTDRKVNGRKAIVIEAVMKLNGTTAMEATYSFDARDLMPLTILLENNPGSVSEQTVTVTYESTETSSGCIPVSDAMLTKRYTQAFENFRESNFKVENLVGKPLPGFALPTTTGERYMRRTADALRAPTVVALLDATQGFTPDIVAALRQAADALPYEADLIMAFVDKHVESIEAIVAELRPGEHLLMSATPLVRDCGAASLPAILTVDPMGTVRNVMLGFNNDLSSDVIQAMALISPATAESAPDYNLQTSIPHTETSMETVYFKGQECHTYGSLPEVGSKAPDYNLTSVGLSPVKSEDSAGKTVVLNIFPSLDTEVCAQSVRRFNKEASKLKDTEVICVSQDLPFAMKRFCTVEGLEKVIPASAFRSPQFGEKYGVMLVDGPLAGLLTRAVIIIGPDGKVKYRDLVSEITEEPDYEAAIRVLKGKY